MDTSMSVPAFTVELVTSSLITGLAERMARPNRQSSRVRVMKLRDARGAVGCGARWSHFTAGAGVTSTVDTAENKDAVTIRCPPRG
jgi:histidine ammonia-lyase